MVNHSVQSKGIDFNSQPNCPMKLTKILSRLKATFEMANLVMVEVIMNKQYSMIAKVCPTTITPNIHSLSYLVLSQMADC